MDENDTDAVSSCDIVGIFVTVFLGSKKLMRNWFFLAGAAVLVTLPFLPGRTEMRPQDGGLVADGVRAMRDDDTRMYTEMRPQDEGLIAHGVRAMRDDNARTYTEMRPQDGGLIAHRVWAMRDDDAAQWLLREWVTGGISKKWNPLRRTIEQYVHSTLETHTDWEFW